MSPDANSSVNAQHLWQPGQSISQGEKNTTLEENIKYAGISGLLSPSAAKPAKAFQLFLTFLTLESHNSRAPFSSSCTRSSFKPIHPRDTRQAWHARETKQARRPFLACTERLRNRKGKLVSSGTLHSHLAGR